MANESSIKLKAIGNTISLLLPGETKPVTFYKKPEIQKIYEEIVSCIESYNRFNRPVYLSTIKELLNDIEKSKKPKIIAENRIQKKIEKAKIAEIVETLQEEKKKVELPEQLGAIPGFVTTSTGMRLDGFNFDLPSDFIKEVHNWHNKGENLQPLINFILLLSTNPVKHVREDLFTFIRQHKYLLTPNGYIVGFRNVHIHKKGEKSSMDDALWNFVQETIIVAKMQKKSPSRYWIVKNDDGTYKHTRSELQKDQAIGNLQDLFTQGKTIDPTIYTDQHTKTFRIKLGVPVKMDRKDCDSSKKSCSTGLHITNFKNLSSWSSQGYGKVSLMCLVNPANIVSVPYEDKFRCCEYFPVAEVDRSKIDNIWKDEYKVFDDDYAKVDFETIKEMVKEVETDLDNYPDLRKEDLKDLNEKIKDQRKSLKNVLRKVVVENPKNIKGEAITHLTKEEIGTILQTRVQLIA